jgi:hypothetical protein
MSKSRSTRFHSDETRDRNVSQTRRQGWFLPGYLDCVIAVVLFVLRILWRFVSAHEQLAGALDIIARKMRDDARPGVGFQARLPANRD